jgi:predicted DNA-binding protein with PD1-like motif
MKTYVFRLHPGQDLRQEIDKFVQKKQIKAGCILTCVGNLSQVTIRSAESSVIKKFTGSYEIVSLTGTLEIDNSHLHISISDNNYKTFGGHLKEGTIVGTTAEIVIGELKNISFKRKYDQETKFEELIIES